MKNKITKILRELEFNKQKILKNYINAAMECQKLGEYYNALCYFERALNMILSDDSKDSVIEKLLKIPNILYSIEVLQHKLGLFEPSLEVAFIRLELYGDSLPPMIVSDILMNIGVLYQELSKYDHALYYFWQAFNIRFEIYKDSSISGDEYILLSDIMTRIEFNHYKAGHYIEALEFCKIRIDSYELSYGYTSSIISDTMITMATLYDAMGRHDDAYYYLQGALDISNKINDYEAGLIIEEMIHEITSKIERLTNSQEPINNILGDSLNRFGYSVQDVERDGNCFFRAAALSLDLPESLHSLLREQTVKYMTNNLDLFLGFAENIDLEISNMERDGEWADHLSMQAFADVFHINIDLYTIHGDNFFSITSRTTDLARNICLLYVENHYMALFDFVIGDDLSVLGQEAQLDTLPCAAQPFLNHTMIQRREFFGTNLDMDIGIDDEFCSESYEPWA